jgi:ParB-like chromosome segregation protein Spo0J
MSKPFDWRKYLPVHPAADLFPLLSPDELQALADDIKVHGIRTQIIFDEDGKLLDGRNRLDALALLGLLSVGDDGRLAGIKWRIEQGDPYGIVLSLNVHRRHLTPEQKDEVIAKILKAKSELSNRQIGKLVKADHHKVAKVRRKAESTGEVSPVEKTVGADGKKRKAKAAKKKAATRPKAEKPRVLEEYLGSIEGAGRTGKYVILYRAVFGPFDSEEEAQRWAQARYPYAGRWGDKEVEQEPPAVVQPTPTVNGNVIDPGESAKAMKAAHAAQENDDLDIPECLRR